MVRRRAPEGDERAATEPAMDGKHFARALTFAFRACPTSEGQARMSHVAFVGNKIVCADGERWHVGLMPLVLEAPFIAARESVQELLLGLDYAYRISKRHSSQFTVRMNADGLVLVSFGTKSPIEHQLLSCDVGHVPEEWQEPVADDAPPMAQPPEFRCGHLKEAMQWYRAWDKDHGTCTIRGEGGSNPVRVDIVAGGDRVACAFLLPTAHPPAYLVHDEPLFRQLNPGKVVGQSVLDLQLDGDGEAARPHSILVDGKKFNIQGLNETIDELVGTSPCIHKPKGEGEACKDCTSDRIRDARKNKKKREKEMHDAGAPAEVEEESTDA